MAKLTANQINDFKVWFKPDGDPDFSPEHNNYVIKETLRKNAVREQEIQKKFAFAIEERADAVAHLLKAIDKGKDTNAEKYFGKSELARLRGERIVGEYRLRLASMQRQLHAEKKLIN